MRIRCFERSRSVRCARPRCKPRIPDQVLAAGFIGRIEMCAKRRRFAVAILATTAFVAAAQTPVPQRPGQVRSFAQWDKIQISVTAKLAPNLYILQGAPDLDTNHPDAAGGRVVVLFGPDGILMVDSQDEELHEKLLETIRTFSSAPIRILVNSHIHSDHTGGDPFFAKQGALIFSREELQ